MKGYHDIVGDGGSRVLEQVVEQRARITDGLAGVRHLVAVGSGKGGVGKSTLDAASRERPARPRASDRDPGRRLQRPLAGAHGGRPGRGVCPGQPQGRAARGRRNGIGVFSMGSLIPESESLEFESAARGESHTWRATREFALLGEILGSSSGASSTAAVRSAAWGRADRPVRRLPRPADVVRARDDPVRGVTRRGRALGRRSVEGTQSPARLRREHERLLLPRLQRHQAAVRLSRGRSALDIPCLGTVPFDPELARHCDRGIPLAELPETPVGRALDAFAQQLLDSLDSAKSGQGASPMKFLCVPCDTPMKLQSVGPPERGSLSVVYSCPGVRLRDGDADQCVRDAGRSVPGRADRSRDGREGGHVGRSATASGKVPVHRDDSGERASRTQPVRRADVAVRWTAAAEARLANIPEFVRPMARTGIETVRP